PDVAAGGALVGHEAADEGDFFAVRRVAGDGDLEAVKGGVGGVGIENGAWLFGDGVGVDTDGCGPELRDPPIVFARGVGGDVGDFLAGRSPIKLVDVERERSEEAAVAGGGID